jgi:hypothetical protein
MTNNKRHELAKRNELIISLVKQGYSFTAVSRMFNIDVSTVKRIYDEVVTPIGLEWGEYVVCPMTGDTFVHISGDPVHIKGNDHYDAWEGRGDACILKFYSENGYAWDLRFGEHKGNVFMKVENIHETVV